MSTVMYFHGFASVGSGSKVDLLKTTLLETKIVSPNLPFEPNQVIEVVDATIQPLLPMSFPLVFVGTSLGGFWAYYFSQLYDAKCVLVNPQISPSNSFKSKVSTIHKNYHTNEPLEITLNSINQFEKLEKDAKFLRNGKLINLFLAQDDDVIDYHTTLDLIPYYNFCSITDTGGHRYESKWVNVVNHVKLLINE